MNYSKLNFLVIGYGSIGRQHVEILKKFGIKNINILTSQKKVGKNFFQGLQKIKKLNPDYIIIASPTTSHFRHLSFIERNFKNKSILVEKPLFDKFKKLTIRNNRVVIGYNMRFHPILQKIKEIVKNKKIIYASSVCSSYMPDWRKNIDYKKSISAKKKFGGGIRLELSHEIDFLLWIFKDLKLNFAINKKVSNLNINTDDLLSLSCSNKRLDYLSVNLNFFSKYTSRTMQIESNDFSIYADLINFKLRLIKKRNNFEKNYKFKKKNLLEIEILNFIKKDFDKFCSYKQGVKIIKFLDKIKKY